MQPYDEEDMTAEQDVRNMPTDIGQGEEDVSLEQFLATASPEDIRMLRAQAEQEEMRQLDSMAAFGAAVQGMVDEAVEARRKSGIEQRWLDDLRQYYGSDWSLISASGIINNAAVNEAPAKGSDSKQRQAKSKILVNITRPKTNGAISRLSDMLLPTDDRNWGIKPTPNPDLVADLNSETKLTRQGQPMMGPDGQQMTVGDAAESEISKARKACDRMISTIEDQLVECNYNAEFRRSLWDKCVLGTQILRGPFVRLVKKKKWVEGDEGWKMEIQEREVPASERVNPWNFYPDPGCGGVVKNSRYTVEEAEYNSKTLRALRGQPSFVNSQIELCLRERPDVPTDRHNRNQRFIDGEYEAADDVTYRVYMVHGEFERGQLADAGVKECNCETDEEAMDVVSGCVFLCNGRVIKAHLNPLDSEELPYDVDVYEKIEGQLFGVGVPFVLRNPSRVVIAGWRMAMDNSALSGGVQVIVNRKLVEPADGSWSLSGTKVWLAKDGTEDVQKAFNVHQVESRIPEIMQVIERALHFAEDESSMPAIMEGSQKQAPEQVGVANLLANNSNTVLRRLVKGTDDNITDPHISRYYDWNMQHSEDSSIKGDFQVDARGTSVLMVRDGQKQVLMQIGQFVLHPLLGKFHKRAGFDWLKSVYESNHVDSQSILVEDNEVEGIIKQMQEQAAQQAQAPAAPQIEVAKIRGQVETQKLQASQEDAERERQHDMMKLDKELELQYLKYSNEQNVTLESTKNKMIELMAVRQSNAEERAVKERMQLRELDMKARMGTGI